MALTLEEARTAALVAHPGWRSDDIDRLARTMIVKAERLEALDAMNEAVERLQADADDQNAADYDPAPSLGRVGGTASAWDALDDGREQALWDRNLESAEREVARAAEQTARDAAPEGWSY